MCKYNPGVKWARVSVFREQKAKWKHINVVPVINGETNVVLPQLLIVHPQIITFSSTFDKNPAVACGDGT